MRRDVGGRSFADRHAVEYDDRATELAHLVSDRQPRDAGPHHHHVDGFITVESRGVGCNLHIGPKRAGPFGVDIHGSGLPPTCNAARLLMFRPPSDAPDARPALRATVLPGTAAA